MGIMGIMGLMGLMGLMGIMGIMNFHFQLFHVYQLSYYYPSFSCFFRKIFLLLLDIPCWILDIEFGCGYAALSIFVYFVDKTAADAQNTKKYC